MFRECECRAAKTKNEKLVYNSIINLSNCDFFYRKIYTFFDAPSGIQEDFYSIYFSGIDSHWVFNSEEDRDDSYNTLVRELCYER